ncbi:MAG TPA: LytR family transcriptional regulator [Chloroflexi bacterium]|nr:LytR family transcriptional regulator [Chloroflexota bacterium]
MLKNKRYLIFIIGFILLGLVILGLQLRGGLPFSRPSNQRVLPLGGTPTPTAFQPLESTPTYYPTDYPTPTPTLTPTPAHIVPVSNAVGVDPIVQPDHQINIMILGSDQKYKGSIGRTDSIVLLTINTEEGTVNVTSFPRDLYVYIPRWTDQRINTAFAHGGFPLFQDTMLHNFGFRPDYYLLVNLWTFEYIVDDLGGIYVDVPRTVCDDKWGGGLSHCVYPGRQHFYSKEALWYVRSRVTTNDFDRNYRQQLVLSAILDRLISLESLTRIPQLYNTYIQNVTTNLDVATLLSLSPTAAKLSDKSRINQYFITESMITAWVTPSGAQVLLPNFQMIRNMLNNALNSP